jgi:uncharacterized cysteine cluster protein YcgN (CxxCxxCC family)
MFQLLTDQVAMHIEEQEVKAVDGNVGEEMSCSHHPSHSKRKKINHTCLKLILWEVDQFKWRPKLKSH